jgi:hypothetical protein
LQDDVGVRKLVGVYIIANTLFNLHTLVASIQIPLSIHNTGTPHTARLDEQHQLQSMLLTKNILSTCDRIDAKLRSQLHNLMFL